MASRSSLGMADCCRDCRRLLSQIFSNSQASASGESPAYVHSKLESLFASASSCALCNYFIQNDWRYVPEYLEECARTWPHEDVTWKLQRDGPLPHISPVHSSPWTRLTVRAERPDSDISPSLLCELRLTADTGSKAFQNGDVALRTRLNRSCGTEALDLLRSWLRCCTTQHSACLRSRNGYLIDLSQESLLPTRVLDVGADPSGIVRVCETNGRRARYVTLSHCWGPPGKVRPRTTLETLSQHMQCIAISDLSKTFQDAVAVVRAIGIRYLWIDSLCIVQDDPADWQKEAENMGNYYEQSYLTIAACADKADRDGLFSQWDRQPAILEVPYIERHGLSQGHLLLTPLFYDKPKTFAALQHRAWTAQEQVLSRRMIRYHNDSLVWECREATSTDCGLTIARLAPDITDWQKFAENYTSRSVTYVKDRLIAIQGLVNVLQPIRQDTYTSGFWLSDLPLQLLWYSEDIMKTSEDLSRFPSWSWASRFGFYMPFEGDVYPCSWRAACQVLNAASDGAIHLLGAVRPNRDLYLENLESGWPEYPSEHPLMRLRHEIRGIIEWADGLDDLMLPGYPLPGRIVMMVDAFGKVCGWLVLDFSNDSNDQFYLLLVALPIQSQRVTHGLALVMQPSTKAPDTYSRIGMGLIGGVLFDEVAATEHRSIVLV